MAISRISSATNNGTIVTLGDHAKGDTIVYIAYNEASGTIPTLPANVLGLYTRSLILHKQPEHSKIRLLIYGCLGI